MSSDILDNWQQHLPNWIDRVAHIKQNDKLTNFRFIVGPEKIVFNAHKLILAVSSPEFEKLFYLSESEMNEIVLLETSSESFNDFINFIYTGELEITHGNIEDLLELSQLYQITILTKKCEIFMNEESVVKKENVLKLLDLTSIHKLTELETICLKIVQENAIDLIDSPEFLKISQSTLAKIVESEMLSCTEIKLFKAVIKWSDFQCKSKQLKITSENKRSVVGDILSKIRFGRMTLAEFSECSIDSTPLTSDEIIGILQNLAKTFRSSEIKMEKLIRFVDGPSKTQVLKFPQCRNLLSISVNRKIFLFGCGIYGKQQTSQTITKSVFN